MLCLCIEGWIGNLNLDCRYESNISIATLVPSGQLELKGSILNSLREGVIKSESHRRKPERGGRGKQPLS